MYFALWVILFLLLCFISVIKNLDVLLDVLNGRLMGVFGYFLIIAILVSVIASMIGVGFRR